MASQGDGASSHGDLKRAIVSSVDEDAIRELLTRLARPHPSGGKVVERAAILAEGADFTEVVDWIIDHSGRPDAPVAAASTGGLHGSRNVEPLRADQRRALRYVLPADVLA
jgi:hypothetical protein